MALYYRDKPAGPTRILYVYLAVLCVALVTIAGASAIWLTTDNSGTNAIATDPQSTTHRHRSLLVEHRRHR